MFSFCAKSLRVDTRCFLKNKGTLKRLGYFSYEKPSEIVCYAMRHGESEYNVRLVESMKLFGESNIYD